MCLGRVGCATYGGLARLLLIGDDVQDVVGDADIFDGVSADVELRDRPEVGGVLGDANDLLHADVHPEVDVGQLSLVGLAILELYGDGEVDGCFQE